jgi:hypothetical protein
MATNFAISHPPGSPGEYQPRLSAHRIDDTVATGMASGTRMASSSHRTRDASLNILQ